MIVKKKTKRILKAPKTDPKKIEEFEKEIKRTELTPLGWEVTPVNALLKKKLSEVEFLVDGLIPKGSVTFLSGNPGCGKSWVMMEIARAVASGRLVFDKINTKEGKILFIDEETLESEGKRRWQKLNVPYMTLIDVMHLQGFKLDNQERRRALLQLCKYREYNVIIFDSFRDIHSQNENDSQQMQILMDHFKEFNRLGITIILSHHNRKESFLASKDPTQILRGSSAILAGIDSLIAIDSEKLSGTTLELTVMPSKMRQGKLHDSFKVNMIEKEEGKIDWNYLGEIESEATKLEKTLLAIVDLLRTEGELYSSEITSLLLPIGYSSRTISRAIKQLREEKKLKEKVGEKNRVYFSLPVEEKEIDKLL